MQFVRFENAFLRHAVSFSHRHEPAIIVILREFKFRGAFRIQSLYDLFFGQPWAADLECDSVAAHRAVVHQHAMPEYITTNQRDETLAGHLDADERQLQSRNR